jgi:hypothetical protein
MAYRKGTALTAALMLDESNWKREPSNRERTIPANIPLSGHLHDESAVLGLRRQNAVWTRSRQTC